MFLLLACTGSTPSDSGSADSGADSTQPENTAPDTPSVTLTPADAMYGDALLCEATAEDADGDSLTWTYAWTVDGADAGLDGAEVPADTTQPWETWTCTATASDGQAESSGQASVTPLDECTGLAIDVTHGYPMALPTQGSMIDLALGSGGAYTIETWFRLDGSDPGALFYKGPAEDTPSSLYMNHLLSVAPDQIHWGTAWSGSGNDCDYLVVEAEIDDAFHHIAVTIDTTTYEKAVFLDGVELERCTGSGINGYGDGPLWVGAMAWGNLQTGQIWSQGSIDGVMDEARYSSTIRYTEDFTPSKWHQPDGDTIALWHMSDLTDAAGTYDLQTLGGADVSDSGSACDG